MQSVSPKRKKKREKPDGEIDVEGFKRLGRGLKTSTFFPDDEKFRRFAPTGVKTRRQGNGLRSQTGSFARNSAKSGEQKTADYGFRRQYGLSRFTREQSKSFSARRMVYNVMDEAFNLHAKETKSRRLTSSKTDRRRTVTSVGIFQPRRQRHRALFRQTQTRHSRNAQGANSSPNWKKLIGSEKNNRERHKTNEKLNFSNGRGKAG